MENQAENGEDDNHELYYYVPNNNTDTAWQKAVRPDLPLRNNAGQVVTEEEWVAEHNELDKNLWAKKISDWASGKFPSYRLGERTHADGLSEGSASSEAKLREAVPSEDFVREMCRDARELVIGCAVHLCSPSCYKYHSSGKHHICRHNYYHVVSLTTEKYKDVSRRRKGKPLRSCLAIIRETQWGMAGRILTFQMHPWECTTTYAGLVSMRCNLDVQDLRRTLPPAMWMPSEVLEREPTEEELKYSYMHGAYPQRVQDFSQGPQDNWGWMQHLGTTETTANQFGTFQDWDQIFASIADYEQSLNKEELAEMENVYKECNRAAHMAFVDNHNAGYYINSYTTKLNPTMDNVLRKLLDSVRRLQNEWQESAAAKESSQDGDEKKDARRENFRRSMQVLCRFESSFRRASWKSGCEMAFPILFGHLSFTTHRCWTVYMRKAIFLAAEAWRMHYGQIATGRKDNLEANLDFKLPSTGETVTLPGWRAETRQGEDGDYLVYISPDGEAFDSLEYAHDAIKQASKNSHEKTQAVRAMSRLLLDFKEGYSIEPTEAPVDSVIAAASRAGQATGFALSQLDDYLHRGTHPIVKDMSLYIYSMWVYRAERSPFARDASACQRNVRRPRHIEIPFHESYAATRTWTQRIAKEPRVPRPEGYRFVTDADPEMHYLLKAILLRPIYLPDQRAETDTKEELQLRAFEDSTRNLFIEYKKRSHG